jgi:hypothetical protein
MRLLVCKPCSTRKSSRIPAPTLWLQRDDVPLILGQANFFMEFDVCFFSTRGVFQLQPATP